MGRVMVVCVVLFVSFVATPAQTADCRSDWPALARYHEDNKKIAPVSDYEIRDDKPIIQTARRPPEKILALNQWMKEYARTHYHAYLDYFSAMADEKGFLKDELSNDGLHPNPQGYAVMAPLAQAAITASLKRRR